MATAGWAALLHYGSLGKAATAAADTNATVMQAAGAAAVVVVTVAVG